MCSKTFLLFLQLFQPQDPHACHIVREALPLIVVKPPDYITDDETLALFETILGEYTLVQPRRYKFGRFVILLADYDAVMEKSPLEIVIRKECNGLTVNDDCIKLCIQMTQFHYSKGGSQHILDNIKALLSIYLTKNGENSSWLYAQ